MKIPTWLTNPCLWSYNLLQLLFLFSAFRMQSEVCLILRYGITADGSRMMRWRLLIPLSRWVFRAHELRSLGRIRLQQLKHCLLKTSAFASLIAYCCLLWLLHIAGLQSWRTRWRRKTVHGWQAAFAHSWHFQHLLCVYFWVVFDLHLSATFIFRQKNSTIPQTRHHWHTQTDAYTQSATLQRAMNES